MPCRIRNTPQVFGPLNNECLLHTGITFIVPISANESIANCVKPLIEETERESVKRKTSPSPAPAPLVALLLVHMTSMELLVEQRKAFCFQRI